MTKQVCLIPYTESIELFLFVCLFSILTYTLVPVGDFAPVATHSYTILLTRSDIILYRKRFLDGLQPWFSTVSHNHNSLNMFVHIQTSAGDKSHVSSTASAVSLSMLINVSKGILRRKHHLSLHISCMSHRSGPVWHPHTQEKRYGNLWLLQINVMQ